MVFYFHLSAVMFSFVPFTAKVKTIIIYIVFVLKNVNCPIKGRTRIREVQPMMNNWEFPVGVGLSGQSIILVDWSAYL